MFGGRHHQQGGSSITGSGQSPCVIQAKGDFVKMDNCLSISNNSDLLNNSNRQDGSTSSSQDGSISSRLSFSEDIVEYGKKRESSSRHKESRSKKKSWFSNPFYTTYKTRCEDFKKVFKDIPDEERLLVDYSCAIQRDILLHGRLYITPNYLCFHSNILGYETVVNLKWKDVATITKEKTAVVIPNAIQISTSREEKYFFASFISRDAVHLMLLRVWQHSKVNTPLNSQQLWQLIHESYGNELGLNSDDEDLYLTPALEFKTLPRISVESSSYSDECTLTVDNQQNNIVEQQTVKQSLSKPLNVGLSQSETNLAAMSDTESEPEKLPVIQELQCSSAHDGRLLLNEVISLHVDNLFTLLFTNSKFYLDFHAARKTKDMTQTVWIDDVNNCKTRILNLTVTTHQNIGPKTAQVTETQVMLSCSKAGHLYAIDTDIQHAGIPYADNFYIVLHYCLRKISDTQSSIAVYAQIKYKKSMWGLVRSMLERNCWSEMVDFFTSLHKALQFEAEENTNPTKSTSRKKLRLDSLQESICHSAPSLPQQNDGNMFSFNSVIGSSVMFVFCVLVVLMMLNIVLYWRLKSAETGLPLKSINIFDNVDTLPKTPAEWATMLHEQETLRTVEVQKWKQLLNDTIQLLIQAEKSLNKLYQSLETTHQNHMATTLNTHKLKEKSNEL